VTYDLTNVGRSPHCITRELRGWAQDHMDAVLASPEGYDAG
jgi:DNA-binding HxlR family transcriptional regulator